MRYGIAGPVRDGSRLDGQAGHIPYGGSLGAVQCGVYDVSGVVFDGNRIQSHVLGGAHQDDPRIVDLGAQRLAEGHVQGARPGVVV